MYRIQFWSVEELTAAYRAQKISPVEVVTMMLDRIERYDRELNAYRTVDAEAALLAARSSERRWRDGAPLSRIDGVPTSIKDMIDARGLPTQRGSLLLQHVTPAMEDAPAVQRLREAGAVILGKTNTCEFGWKGTTDSRLHGITRNPWNTALTPGGSSGGAAAALAAGLCTLALGTDGGGSIRNPSSFTNLTGLKATYGRVPAYPPNPIGSLANVCPMARRVDDLTAMLEVIAQPDRRDWDSLPMPMPRPDLNRVAVAGTKIGYSRRLGYAPQVDPEVAAIVENAVALVAAQGAHIEEIEPDIGDPTDTFGVHWQVGVANVMGGMSADKLALLDPGLAGFVELGRAIPLSRYLDAQNARIVLGRKLRQLFDGIDLLILPTTAVAAFPADQAAPSGMDDYDWRAWSPFASIFNLTRLPAMSIPAGFTQDGRPVGLQIVGDHFAESKVLEFACAFEALNPLYQLHPSCFD